MNNERVTYAELNLAKDSRRQQIKPKGTKSSISTVSISFLSVSLSLPVDFPSCSEKLSAGILGVTCVVLLSTVVKIAVNPPPGISEQSNSSPVTGNEKVHHCGRCPKEWFTYSNNCYYISNEHKTWTESVITCASKNSTLLLIDNEEEKQFLSSISPVSWIGVFRNSSDHKWMLINGSPFKLKIAELSSVNDDCAVLSSSGLMSSVCGSSKVYLCKHKLQS
nr:PREDICTED: NKG2-C type II integral membrane protein-like [Rhinolophus sinicus]